MCGIAGVLAFSNSGSRVDAQRIDRMRDAMALRGPDGAGTWVAADGGVGLGHRRLSIIDLSSAAAQPMHSREGDVHIVFNGEIYNHAELRKELTGRGRRQWQTDHSDTEVVLQAYEEWGIECLSRLRGMFAIAIWDGRTGKLWLARDRIGIKPLYYAQHRGRLAFASEIKALLTDPDQARALNEAALNHYLSFLVVPAPHTMFEGISKLPAAHWLCARMDGSTELRRYWSPWKNASPTDGLSDDEMAGQLLGQLSDAVAVHKVSDVPVGVFLSGGIDSSTNAVLFSEGEASPVRTFTVGYREEHPGYRNETREARQMAERIGARHEERLLSDQDLINFLPRMIHLQDEPLADPVCFPVFEVSRLARESGVTVCHVGEGADELFYGYPFWARTLKAQRLADLPGARVAARGLSLAAGRSRALPREWMRRSAADQPLFWGGAEAFTEAGKQRLLAPRLRTALAGATSWDVLEPLYRQFRDEAWDPHPLHWMTHLDLHLRLPELLLMRVDKMAMGVSLECRVPFLDHRFVEFALGMPAAAKFRHGELKYMLKKAVRSKLPAELLTRRKQGFGVPVGRWLRGPLGRQVAETVRDVARRTDLFDADEIDFLLNQCHERRVWCLYNFALWWKHYIAQESP